MLSTETRYEHVVLQDAIPTIAGTSMKVKELVVESLAHGWSPEELLFQHPYLTMGQIHSALAYYWDHKNSFDLEIEGDLKRADRLRQEAGSTPFRDRLRLNRVEVLPL
jgi:uncharacterized protein (DUF433 family)